MQYDKRNTSTIQKEGEEARLQRVRLAAIAVFKTKGWHVKPWRKGECGYHA